MPDNEPLRRTGAASRSRLLERRPVPARPLNVGPLYGLTHGQPEMHAEISYDLVMGDDMSFVEGTYRLPGRDWQVFIFGPDSSVTEPQIVTGKWPSGVTGVFVKWPASKRLNTADVLETLSAQLGVTAWSEVRGPDSMQLR